MADFISFITSNTNKATIRKQPLIYINSLLIPPRSPIRTKLLLDGWKYKNRLSASLPIRGFVISESQYNSLYLLSPEEIEDLLLIDCFKMSNIDLLPQTP